MAKLKTGRHTSVLKELRKSIKRNKLNTSKKSTLKTMFKKVEDAAAKKDTETTKTLVSKTFSLYDKASKSNCVHKNKAARKKSQLSKKLAQIK